MHRISRQLIDRILDEPDAVRAYGQIGQYIRPRDEGEPELGLSRPEMNLYMFSIYDAEVGRNGHTEFFLNPDGGLSQRILTALEEMGLASARDILLEACSAFPNSVVPTSTEERIAAIKGLPYAETRALWDRLDDRYAGEWQEHRSVLGRIMAYLRSHRDEVLGPETA